MNPLPLQFAFYCLTLCSLAQTTTPSVLSAGRNIDIPALRKQITLNHPWLASIRSSPIFNRPAIFDSGRPTCNMRTMPPEESRAGRPFQSPNLQRFAIRQNLILGNASGCRDTSFVRLIGLTNSVPYEGVVEHTKDMAFSFGNENNYGVPMDVYYHQ